MTGVETTFANPDTTETPSERLGRIVAHLETIRDPQARFGWLVELARKRPPLDPVYRIEANRITGCMVRSWWVAEFVEGRCRFATDSDAVTLKAMLGLIADICTGGTPADITAIDFGFLDSMGLLRQLAENRQATVRKIAAAAKGFAEGVR